MPDGDNDRSGDRGTSAPDVLAGRYRLGPLVGRGGSGQVHQAWDSVTEAEVAVKFVRALSEGHARQLRRELTALRLLDLPGVVRLLDDGVDDGLDGQTFLVMQLLPGGSFDTLARRGGWTTWREEALSVLEALARVHFAGVVHRDLKPSNVLLDPGGRPVLTDFGLAQGLAVEDPSVGWREGTPRYMAPEQVRGEACDARADVYAVGVMFAEMLEGHPVPREVAEVVAAMREERPGDRPGSALEVFEALGGGSRAMFGSLASLPERPTAADLAPLFEDAEASFLHLADAAALLHRRAGPDRAAVRAELDRWVRAGRCHWSGDRIVLTRTAIASLQWEDDPARAALAAAVAAGDARATESALAEARRAHAVGSTGRAFALLEAVAGPGEDAVALTLVDLALSLQQGEVVRRAIYLAQRHQWPTCLALLQAARVALHVDPVRGLDQLGRLPALDDPTLEGWRLALAVWAATHASPDELPGWIERARRWADRDAGRRARVASWEARVAYAAGRFAEALAHEREALLGAETPFQRLARLTNAAAAALEVPDLALADELAGAALALARELRHAVGEARATWLVRAAAYRRGTPGAPRPDLVRAAGAVSPALAAQLGLTEAAVAWRSGDRALASDLAAEAARAFRGLSFVDGEVLATSLAAACGGAEPPSLDDVRRCQGPIAVQALALCRMAGHALEDPSLTARAEALRGRAMDVLTGDECRRALASEV